MASLIPVPNDDEDSVTAINMRNRAILYSTNNPNASFSPAVLNLLNNLPNDEAAESRLFAGTVQRRSSTIADLDGAADRPTNPQGTKDTADEKENDDSKPDLPPFFRCCQCQYTSRIPRCQRPEEKVGVVQAKEQRVLIVNSPCQHSKCFRCINVDETGVRIGIKPWQLEWRGPTRSTRSTRSTQA
ncbi:hypothetical protein DSL72_001796 [Monilinia vaccinii-corymbosi]|uniref:Uncharacterized protein n=1 Tax=Monilinia vaccinii-corymbosi TaxID=61207 RepID=A0A8A3PAT5_9HELO|nr:hypothetical protein DSL72_001796 [Monilinia vaccinii-corymbosi]